MSAQLDFLMPPAPDARVGSDREDAIARLKEEVLPALLRRALARANADELPGVTADDVLQLCKGHPQSALIGTGQRAFSWVGPWLTSLARSGALVEYRLGTYVVRRRSTRPGAHGNLQIVYVHPSDRRAAPGQP